MRQSSKKAAALILLLLITCLVFAFLVAGKFYISALVVGVVLLVEVYSLFHLMDLSQLYTVLFCLWFLVLGAIEYFVLRFIWRRWFSLAD